MTKIEKHEKKKLCADNKWKVTAAILCGFGLFKEFQPSQPFILDYAVEHANFTAGEIHKEALPWTTYGYAASLLIFLLITDLLRYKKVIIFGAAALVVSWSLTIWKYTNLKHAQLRQFMYAISLGSDVAYHTYMYANVDKSHYQAVTSYSHAAKHAGGFFGGLTGQLLFSFHILPLDEMNYISFGAVVTALLLSFFLPRVKRSLHMYCESTPTSVSNCAPQQVMAHVTHKIKERKFRVSLKGMSTEKTPVVVEEEIGFLDLCKQAIPSGRLDLKRAYSNIYVLKWSIWWCIALPIYLQVGLYAESLWKEVEEDAHHHGDNTHYYPLNGAVEAAHSFLSSVLAIGLSFFQCAWNRWGGYYLAFVSLLQAVCLLLMSQTENLYVAQGTYIAFETLYQVAIILATAEIAEAVNEDSEALIFGLNTFMALMIQVGLTYTISSKHGFISGIRTEFVAYAIYEAVLAVGSIILGLLGPGRRKHWKLAHEHTHMNISDENNANSISLSNNNTNY